MISKTQSKNGRLALHCVSQIVFECLFCCSQASTDLNINGLMALSPKAGWLKETKTGSSRVHSPDGVLLLQGPEEPLPDFHLEKAEESSSQSGEYVFL